MTTTTIDNLIAAFALAMIVVPIIALGIQDARRQPWFKSDDIVGKPRR